MRRDKLPRRVALATSGVVGCGLIVFAQTTGFPAVATLFLLVPSVFLLVLVGTVWRHYLGPRVQAPRQTNRGEP